MTNLCGWIGFTAGRGQTTEMAEAMLSACPLTPVNRCVREPAFCATAGPAGQVVESRGLLIALAGQPRWQRETLEAKALAERLAGAFLERGPACLDQVHGHFALAIIDPARATVLLATDRLGIHPLAYQITADGVVFGSSLNSLRRHPDFIADINPQALFDYLYFHMVPSPVTIYRHTSKLLPGQYVLIEADRFDAGFYWHPEYRDRHDPEAALATELKTHLHNAVERCLDPALAPTGAFLSGGLDSSTVTGVYAGLTDSPVQAYSIGFEAEGYDETPSPAPAPIISAPGSTPITSRRRMSPAPCPCWHAPMTSLSATPPPSAPTIAPVSPAMRAYAACWQATAEMSCSPVMPATPSRRCSPSMMPCPAS